MSLVISDLKIYFSEINLHSFSAWIIFVNCTLIVALPLKSFRASSVLTRFMFFGFCIGFCTIQVFGFYAQFLHSNPTKLSLSALFLVILTTTVLWNKRSLKANEAVFKYAHYEKTHN